MELINIINERIKDYGGRDATMYAIIAENWELYRGQRLQKEARKKINALTFIAKAKKRYSSDYEFVEQNFNEKIAWLAFKLCRGHAYIYKIKRHIRLKNAIKLHVSGYV